MLWEAAMWKSVHPCNHSTPRKASHSAGWSSSCWSFPTSPQTQVGQPKGKLSPPGTARWGAGRMALFQSGRPWHSSGCATPLGRCLSSRKAWTPTSLGQEKLDFGSNVSKCSPWGPVGVLYRLSCPDGEMFPQFVLGGGMAGSSLAWWRWRHLSCHFMLSEKHI